MKLPLTKYCIIPKLVVKVQLHLVSSEWQMLNKCVKLVWMLARIILSTQKYWGPRCHYQTSCLFILCWIHPEVKNMQFGARKNWGRLSQLEMSSIFSFQLYSCHLYINAPFYLVLQHSPSRFSFLCGLSLRRKQKKCDFDGLTVSTTECCAALASYDRCPQNGFRNMAVTLSDLIYNI